MQKDLKIETYRKNVLLLLLVFFIITFGFTALFYFITGFKEKSLVGLIGLIPLTFIYIFIQYLFKIIKNYDKIYYLKHNDTNFEYLHIPNLYSNSRGSTISKIQAMYIKPEYFSKGFHNIISFETNHRNQVIMLLDNNEKRTLPILFSSSKLNEALHLLNTWLKNYHKNKTLNN